MVACDDLALRGHRPSAYREDCVHDEYQITEPTTERTFVYLGHSISVCECARVLRVRGPFCIRLTTYRHWRLTCVRLRVGSSIPYSASSSFVDLPCVCSVSGGTGSC
eukprot:scpid17926/ scgid9679/ 